MKRTALAFVLFCAAMPAGHAWSQAVQPDDVAAQANGFDASELEPPASVARVLGDERDRARDAEQRTEQRTKQRTMTWAEVLASVQPTALSQVEPEKAEQVLPEDVRQLIEQADRALGAGELFAAVGLLREAERQAPQLPEVIRGLGVAYSLSGNTLRGKVYLRRAIEREPEDALAAMLLSRASAERGELPEVLAYSGLMKRLGVPDAIVERDRVDVLNRCGYLVASGERLERLIRVIEQDAEARGDAPADANQGEQAEPATSLQDAIISRELAVLRAQLDNFKVQLGDLHLQMDQIDSAMKWYSSARIQGVSDSQRLLDRRLYLALVSGQTELAIASTVEQLASSSSDSAGLSSLKYLIEQGIEPSKLSAAIESKMGDRGITLPLLRGLAQVADQATVLDAAQRWLAERSDDASAYGAVFSLAAFDDRKPEDAESLASLLMSVAKQMREEPASAFERARATVSQIDALVTLLRAVRRDDFAALADADEYAALLTAAAYEQAGRMNDATRWYQRVYERSASLRGQIRLPMAERLIANDQPQQAIELIRADGEPSDWASASLVFRAVAKAGDPDTAIDLLDLWRRTQGKTADSTLLRIELVAMAGNPRRAISDLRTLIGASPKDLRLYELGLELIDRYASNFNSRTEAANTRSVIANQLRTNLPDATVSRLERATSIFGRRNQEAELRQLLLSVLDDEPRNELAWLLLMEHYEDSDEPELADAAHQSMLESGPPGVIRALRSAQRDVLNGQMQRASDTLRNLLALDEEDVVPGPPLTGDQASLLLSMLSAAEPDNDFEAQSLAMVKRFPDSPRLNNGLGYRWTVEGKNLLQAEAMIKRALANGGDSFEVMDSLAWVQYKLGRFDEALATQTKAIEMLRQTQQVNSERLPASMAVLSDHLGDILYRNGDSGAAVRQWQIARIQRLSEEDLMLDPELRTLAQRVDAKINAVRSDQVPQVEPVPGPEAHGPPGHPADPAP